MFKQSQGWRYYKWYLRIWLPVILVTGTGLWLLHDMESRTRLSGIEAEERQIIARADEVIQTHMEILQRDTLYLAHQAMLHGFIDTEWLAKNLLSFARYRGVYDQIRLINEKGQEVIRVNMLSGRPMLVPDKDLQNKADRPYVTKTLGLKKEQVYISKFDLNIENGVIEQPLKPMLRAATPLFDREGKRRGLIVVNHLGQSLLTKLKSIRHESAGDLWLLNDRGDWLLGPSPELEWGFMYSVPRSGLFATTYPAIWRSIQQAKQDLQSEANGALFNSAHVIPNMAFSGLHEEEWRLVSHLSAELLEQKMAGRGLFLLVAFIAMTVLPAVVISILTYQSVRKKTEPIIKDSQQRFSHLLESAPDAIVIVSSEGRINLVNSMAEKIFGYSREELLGEQVEKLIPAHLAEQHSAWRLDYTFNQPQSRFMAADTELYGLRKDGAVFPVEISLSPSKSSKGMQIISIVRDITDRKQAEREKKIVQARFRELVHNLPIGIYRYTLAGEGRFLEVNPSMLEICEADSVEQLLNYPIKKLHCDPETYHRFSDNLEKNGSVYNKEVKVRSLKGREFIVAASATMKQDARGDSYIDGIVEDISERKQNEQYIKKLNDSLRNRSSELEAINQELEAFSYSVSHDLRAPLRAIDGFSQTLLAGYAEKLDETGRDRLNRIRAAAQRMGKLIDDLLNLSRVSRMQLQHETVDVSEIANEVAQELSQGEPERKVRFFIQPELHSLGDSRLLRVVMDNLVGNAWKFTAQREDAQIEVGEQNNGEGHVYYVRDNGAGFDMRYADKLFGAFQRLHDNNEFPGSGIGLATVQRVINKHGGRIWAESEVGKGASFYFTLEQRGNV